VVNPIAHFQRRIYLPSVSLPIDLFRGIFRQLLTTTPASASTPRLANGDKRRWPSITNGVMVTDGHLQVNNFYSIFVN
jgi:hypothetical protein